MKKDLRVKVTPATAKKMSSQLAKGKTLTEVANKYGVSSYAVKYNTNPAFKKAEKIRKSA